MSEEVLKCIIGNGLYALIYSEDYDEVFRVLKSFVPFNLSCLTAVAQPIMDSVSYMDDNMEENSIRIINYFREQEYETKEEREEVFEICNKLILLINSRDKNPKTLLSNRKTYILSILKEKKIKCKMETYKGINSNPTDYFRFAKNFVLSDFRTLLYNTDLVDYPDYCDYLNDFYKLNPFFVNIVESLIDIYPELLTDQTFRMRIKIALEVVKSNIEENEKLSEKAKVKKYKQVDDCLKLFDKKEE